MLASPLNLFCTPSLQMVFWIQETAALKLKAADL